MARRLQRPMSETLARRLSVRRMFCGLMSLCTMPRWCSATTPCPASSISCSHHFDLSDSLYLRGPHQCGTTAMQV